MWPVEGWNSELCFRPDKFQKVSEMSSHTKSRKCHVMHFRIEFNVVLVINSYLQFFTNIQMNP